MKLLKLETILIVLCSILIAQTAVAGNTVYGKGHLGIASIEDSDGTATAISSHSKK